MSARRIARTHFKGIVWSTMVAVTALSTGMTLYLRSHTTPQGRKGSVYTHSGFGGYLPTVGPRPAHTLTDLERLQADYAAGHYDRVQAEAPALIAQQGDANPAKRRAAAQAALLSAYAAAWQKRYEVAGEGFTLSRNIAGSLPDHGAPPPVLGDPEPTLEEEAAFQHAVCVSAEGDRSAAEAEYGDFMQRYPQSILVHAAVKRIARFHGGDVPKDAEGLWRHAMDLQHRQEVARLREQSLCGPECLAELLRRRRTRADVHALASEMHTTEHGTSLAELAATAGRHGFEAQGLELTQAGLAQQKLPAIAFLKTGHYVLVDRLAADSVTLWDPDAHGAGQGAEQQLPLPQWQQAWSGTALTVK